MPKIWEEIPFLIRKMHREEGPISIYHISFIAWKGSITFIYCAESFIIILILLLATLMHSRPRETRI
jgi:hypothetical protein